MGLRPERRPKKTRTQEGPAHQLLQDPRAALDAIFRPSSSPRYCPRSHCRRCSVLQCHDGAYSCAGSNSATPNVRKQRRQLRRSATVQMSGFGRRNCVKRFTTL